MRPRLPILPAILLAGLLAASCSDTADRVDGAGHALRRGDLARAEALIDGMEGPSARSMRERIRRARDRRERARAELSEVEASIPELPRIQAQMRLDRILRGVEDPVVRDEIQVALSGLAERYRLAGATAMATEASAPPAPDLVPDPVPDPVPHPEPGPAFDPYDRTRREPVAADDASVAPTIVVDLEPVGAVEIVDGVAVEPEPEAPEEIRDIVSKARDHLRRGELAAARDAWLEAAAAAAYRVQRAEYAGLSRDIGDRLILREEIGQAVALEPERFADIGIESAGEELLIRDGVELEWRELSGKELLEIAGRVELSRRARFGLIQERLLRQDVIKSFEELAGMVSSGLASNEEASGLVARYRGEYPPSGGYVFHHGDWIPRSDHDRIERDARVVEIAALFAKAEGERRDELLDRFHAEGARTELLAALEARLESAAGALAKNRTMKRLTSLAEARARLDQAREDALELIFDTEEYFYPYRPPECPPEKAKLYPAVQRRVDVLVQGVRDAWGDTTLVRPTDDFRERLEEVTWNLERLAEYAAESAWPDELPPWIAGLDPSAEEVTLADFAWDADEREALAWSRAVRRYNQELWQREEVPENGRRPSVAEKKQVQVTNDYRTMFGRRAVAWNPLIQAAACDHSEYMADTGDFGHFEPEPERKTPGDRMRRRGYTAGASENCHMGGGDPMGAHVGWIHSSGHHRNILTEGHREMASGLVGSYWTQNFGAGRDFQAELEGWRD